LYKQHLLQQGHLTNVNGYSFSITTPMTFLFGTKPM
jgi:hypothetical protein